VSQLPCFNELVRPEETGLLFDHRAPNAIDRLATILARLLREAPLREQLATRAQAHARSYDYAASARSVLAHLQRLVDAVPASK
jgi:hypothetical protein